METIRAAERAEAAYERKMYRYKAQYSLDCENGIENAILMKPQTPEMILDGKVAAGAALHRSDGSAGEAGQADLCPILPGNGGKRNCRSRRCRGVDPSRVRDSIRRGLKQLGKYF